MPAEQGGKRIGQHPSMVRRGAGEPAGMAEYQPRVSLPGGQDVPVEPREVMHILSDDRSAFGCRSLEQILVRQPDEVSALLDGGGVVTPVTQQGRDGGAVHLVEEELHPDRSLRSFSQVASSRSETSKLCAISASISSVNSA